MLRGVAIGSADLVPGVSGGTMALLLGIYRRLIDALGALTGRAFWSAVRERRWKAAWRCADGGFLAALAVGIAIAVLSLTRVLHVLITDHPVSVYAVFFGLIAASAWVVGGRIERHRRIALTTGVLGAVAAFVIVGLVPARTPDTALMLAAAGALAVSALLLPGVSGAFILVLLGKYETVLAALAGFELARLVPLVLGMGVGLLGFSRVLAAALHRWPDAILGLLAGFLVGSLRKVWPWQSGDELISFAVGPPSAADALTASLLAIGAAVAVLLLERIAAGRSDPADG